ncbi:MAG: Ig-like domain-containing protein [Candidatus Brocadiaceae bacterium]|nr:Ig-like domain-containing protein [Candidatus Brocadiaceae bacterium]
MGTNTAVTATFSMYMNGSTLTPDTFKLRSDGGAVTGSVTTNGATATFTPASRLAYNTPYTAKITTGAQAANFTGTTLDSDYLWSFTTESAPDVPTPTVTPSPTPVATPTVVSTVTPTPVSSPTPSPTLAATPAQPAGLHLSKEVAYLSGDTVAVTVVDADGDTNATSEDRLTTALKVTALNYYAGSDLTLDMKEDAVNSGTFLATIKTGTTTNGGASTSVRSNIGTIKTVQGGTATVIYTDTTPNASTITKTLLFSSSDASLAFDASAYAIGSYAVLTYVDAEENEDSTKVDVLLDNAYIETSSFNRAKVRFAETGVDTGTFKGSIQISSSDTLDYDRIQANSGEKLTTWCEDRINTTGVPRVVSATSQVTGSGTSTPTVTPVATISPQPSIASTPSPVECTAEEIALSPVKLLLRRNKRGEVTVTVTGTNGCPVEGKQVTPKVSTGKKFVSVSPASQETDEDGQAVFTIKAMNKKGRARVTFNAEALKKSMNVKVKK